MPSEILDTIRVPSELEQRPQWVCWRQEQRGKRPTKVPIRASDLKRASATKPSDWCDFETALSAYQQNETLAGIGFVFTPDDPFCGIDLDDCINDEGDLVASAQSIVDSLNSYTEISPSGRGVKVFIVGVKPEGARCRTKAVEGFKEIEIYGQKRFFTLTGRHLEGTPSVIENRQDELDSLCGRLWPKKPTPVASRPAILPNPVDNDESLIDRASQAKDGENFKRLWEGNLSLHDGDHSAADLALCNKLAFWTGRDFDRMDRLFRASGLFREKWNEKRGEQTYGQLTLARAIEGCTQVYSPHGRSLGILTDPDDPNEQQPDEEKASLVPLGHRDPASGRLVLSPRRTLPTAEVYIRDHHMHSEGRTLLSYAGLLLEWRGNKYCQVEEEEIKHRLQLWLHRSLRYYTNKRTGALILVDFESNSTTVKQALESIRTYSHQPASTNCPSWLDTRSDRLPVLEVLPCRSSNLHIPTGRQFPPTPALFTINALEFDYVPNARPPERWLEFVRQLWGDDYESVDLLQEWMGYCLTADTSQQKMLLLVGPRRSGKGTIGRVLTELVGKGNVVGPTTSSLAGPFGLQPLIDRSLAIVSDARFAGKSVAAVVERLLCISGEDLLTIDRKHIGSVNMKLPTRFMFLTNELPRLNDASTALAGRFMVLRLTTSFYGQEDPALTEQLLAELPGILLWAIAGWKRLRQRGRFAQPASSEEAIRDLEDLASPVSAFIHERCLVGPRHRTSVNDLYTAWSAWCEQDGRTVVSNKQTFGRDLAAAVPGIRRRRGTDMAPFYEGIGLKGDQP
jgi:P4 family phage/plasmid primase-like protien